MIDGQTCYRPHWEIAKNCPATRSSLLPKIDKILKTEKNCGVKNVYAKALKIISKEKKKQKT